MPHEGTALHVRKQIHHHHHITLSTRRARVGEDPRRQLSDREPETPLPNWVHYSRVEKAHACAKHTATMLPTSHYLTVHIRVLPSIGDVLIREYE